MTRVRIFVLLLVCVPISGIGCVRAHQHAPTQAHAEPELGAQPERGGEPRAIPQVDDRVSVSLEARDQQIHFLQRLVKSTQQSDPEYPNFLFRLGEEYLEKKYDLEQLAYALDDKIYAAHDSANPNLARQLSRQQADYIGEAQAASAAAIEVYRVLVNNVEFASYPRLDQALYFYAFELGQLGEQVQMQATYTRLIKDFPSSPYVPNAYLSFGDHYFNAGEIEKAIRFYEQVTQFGPSSVNAYAHYKLGWCYLNLSGPSGPEYDKSLAAFVASIEATKLGPDGTEASGKQLRHEARRDLVRAYVHVGKPAKAWQLFQAVGDGPDADEQDAREMMELLAKHYSDAGKLAESAYIRDQLAGL